MGTLLLVGLMLAGTAKVAFAEGPGSGWQFKRKLVFDNSAQSESLIDFPVLVVLNGSRIEYGATQDNGEDLRFYDSDETTPLAHEVEQWNESGTSYVWVKAPQVDGASGTDHIWMYYGNSGASDGQAAADVRRLGSTARLSSMAPSTKFASRIPQEVQTGSRHSTSP